MTIARSVNGIGNNAGSGSEDVENASKGLVRFIK